MVNKKDTAKAIDTQVAGLTPQEQRLAQLIAGAVAQAVKDTLAHGKPSKTANLETAEPSTLTTLLAPHRNDSKEGHKQMGGLKYDVAVTMTNGKESQTTAYGRYGFGGKVGGVKQIRLAIAALESKGWKVTNVAKA